MRIAERLSPTQVSSSRIRTVRPRQAGYAVKGNYIPFESDFESPTWVGTLRATVARNDGFGYRGCIETANRICRKLAAYLLSLSHIIW